MGNEVLEYVKQDNIDRIVQDFGEREELHIWLDEKDGYGDVEEIELSASISNNLWISDFESIPEEWLEFIYEDIAESELKTRAERLQNTLISIYDEDKIPYLENELATYIYDDYYKWLESKSEKEVDYGDLTISARISFNYDTAFIAEDLIDARRIIRDNM